MVRLIKLVLNEKNNMEQQFLQLLSQTLKEKVQRFRKMTRDIYLFFKLITFF